MKPIPELKGYICEWAQGDRYIFSTYNRLYQTNSDFSEFKYIGEVPENTLNRLVFSFGILRRLFRRFFYNVIPLNDGGVFVSYGTQLGIIKNKKYIPFSEIGNPFRILRSAAAINENGDIFFGEYSSNSTRCPVNIYKYSQSAKELNIVYTFPAGEIRHIHGIYFDKYEKKLWCLCGDIGNENKISYTNDDFQTLNIVGYGNETWRAVSMLFTKKHIYYGMDAEFTDNYLIRLSRKDFSQKKIGKINGPVYYSYKHNKTLIFAVTAELCPSQSDRNASIYIIKNDKVKKFLYIEKDVFSVKYFLPGAFYFPAGSGGNNNEVFVNTVALKSDSDITYKLGEI